jgi:hypothetical protein
MNPPEHLLAAGDSTPVTLHKQAGRSPFLIVADHAGNLMPRVLGRLGISESECERHVAWDIGIAGVSRLMADAFDATVMQQNYSTPHHRLRPAARLGDVDFGDRQGHCDTWKHRPERKPESCARAGHLPALS